MSVSIEVPQVVTVIDPSPVGVTLYHKPLNVPSIELVGPTLHVGKPVKSSLLAFVLSVVIEPPHGISNAPEQTSFAGGDKEVNVQVEQPVAKPPAFLGTIFHE